MLLSVRHYFSNETIQANKIKEISIIILFLHLKFASFTYLHIHFFQQIDKHGSHFHNMLKVFSFSQIVFFIFLSFCNSLFSHFSLLISFYPYIGLFHSILFYFILYILFHFFCFVPLSNPTKPKIF